MSHLLDAMTIKDQLESLEVKVSNPQTCTERQVNPNKQKINTSTSQFNIRSWCTKLQTRKECVMKRILPVTIAIMLVSLIVLLFKKPAWLYCTKQDKLVVNYPLAVAMSAMTGAVLFLFTTVVM